MDSETFHKAAREAAEGTVIVGKADIDENSPFVRAYKSAGYKEPYGSAGPYAYDAVNLVVEAIRKVGPKDKSLLAKTIRGMEYKGILGVTKFDGFGRTLSGGLSYEVSQDGKWVPQERSEYATGKRKLRGE